MDTRRLLELKVTIERQKESLRKERELFWKKVQKRFNRYHGSLGCSISSDLVSRANNSSIRAYEDDLFGSLKTLKKLVWDNEQIKERIEQYQSDVWAEYREDKKGLRSSVKAKICESRDAEINGILETPSGVSSYEDLMEKISKVKKKALESIGIEVDRLSSRLYLEAQERIDGSREEILNQVVEEAEAFGLGEVVLEAILTSDKV